MKTTFIFLIAFCVAFFLAASPAMAHPNDYDVFNSNLHGKITIENGSIFIHSDTAGTARIAPDGTLAINGKNQSVSPAQHELLVQYATTINDIQRKGMQLAGAAPGFAAGVVADVFAGLFSGESEDQVNKRRECTGA